MEMAVSKVVCAICLKNSTTTPRPTVQRRTRNSKSTTNDSWESVWTESCAESVCKLLDLQLDIFKEYFVTSQQCSSCKQLLRDVDFVIRSMDAMDIKLSQLRVKLAGLMYETIQMWTDESTEPENRASRSMENAIESSAVKYDDEESICAGSFILDSDLKVFSEITVEGEFESVPDLQPTDVSQIQSDSISCQTDHLESIEYSEASHKDGPENPPSVEKSTPKEMSENSCTRLSNRIRKPVQYREDTDEEESSEEPNSSSEIEEQPTSNVKRKSSAVNSEATSKRCRISVPRGISASNIHQKSITNADPEYVLSCQEGPEFGDGFLSEFETDPEDTSPSQMNPQIKPIANSTKRQATPSEILVQKLQDAEEVIEEAVAEGHFASVAQSGTKIKRKQNTKVVNSISCSPFRSLNSELPAHENAELLSTMQFLLELEKEDTEKNYTFICPSTYCGRRFIGFRELRRHHLKEHSQHLFPYEFQCPFCDHYVQFDYMLDAHIIRVHQEQKYGYICPAVDCDMAFASNSKLVRHASYHHPEILLNRNDCSYRAQYRDKSLVGSSEAVLVHRADRSFTSRRMTYCPVEGCSVRCCTQLQMDRHYNKDHVKDPFPYKCTELDCTKAFKVENALSRHMATIHGITGKGTLLNCLFCHYRCLGQSSMNQHMRTAHHKNDAPKFYCKVCNLLFFATEHCEEHEKLHDDKGYDCVISQCKTKRFSHREELVAHVKCEHDGSYRKKYICSTCGKAVKTAYLLKAHVAVHSSDLPFKCNYCDKGFRNTMNRTSHEEIMHGDPLQKKSYNCKLCTATFTARQYLYKHNAWHKHGANANLPVARKKLRNLEVEDAVVEASEKPKRQLRSKTA